MKELIDRLRETQTLDRQEWTALIEGRTPQLAEYLFCQAREVRHRHYGHDIYIRGLIEFTNHCKNDCLYCGIRRSNRSVHRYRLSQEEILSCCESGYALGFRTFVLQGGEDGFFTDERMVQLIAAIKERYPDCALTLSTGEKSRQSYQAYFDAGADRYLLRHETCNARHYAQLHPPGLTAAHRQACLYDLRSIGFQTGTGFMVGSPLSDRCSPCRGHAVYQSPRSADGRHRSVHPPSRDPLCRSRRRHTGAHALYAGAAAAHAPRVLLPATTALATIHPQGRELGILAGANVVMPNLSPAQVRGDYTLYDNKAHTGVEAAECRHDLQSRMNAIGYQIAVSRGDALQ